jgi:NNP family nitrate/nitrite transporter-like MFS transporter
MSTALTASPQQTRRVLSLSTGAFTLLFAVWLMLGVLAVPLRTEFTWLTAIAILSGSLFRLPFGVWTDKVGGKVMMTGILALTAIPCYLMSHVTTFEGAMVCAGLYGLAGNSFSVGIAWNAAWFPRERQGAALGTFGAGNVGASVTKLFGPQLMLAIPAVGYFGGLIPGGWRAIPVFYSALLVGAALLVWFFSPGEDKKPGHGRPLAELLVPLKDVRVWRFGLYYVLVFGAYVALSLWLPNYYTTVYELSLPKAALLTAFFIFPASLLRPLGGYLSDKFGARPVTYTVFIGMLITSALLSLRSAQLPLPAFFCLTLLLGVGMGVGKASVYKFVPDYYPKDVGLVGGLVGTLGGLGGFVLPLSFGYIESVTGRPESCFYALSVLSVVCLAWLHLVVSRLGGVALSRPPRALA